MKIEDLIQLINNRLRDFQLSRDYARMNGDLARMNTADKEIISLEDTLFKLNLLVDTSKSAAVKEATLAEVITDGSVAVLGEYNITSYATDPLHEEKIMNILSKMGVMDTAEKIDDYIKDKYWSSPVTGEMVISAASAHSVDARLMMAIMEQDSSFATAGKAVRTLNPGNVGNDDSGNLRTYDSWQEGVTAVAAWLSRHRGSTNIFEIPNMATSTPPIATSTPFASPEPVAEAGEPTTITSTTTTPTTTPVTTTTSTPEIIITPTTTTTTTIATSTPFASPEPVAEAGEPTTITSTTTTATTTPETTTTSTPEIIPEIVPEIITEITSTTTTTTATSTEQAP